MSVLSVLIVAGGSGKRMGAEIPKQFLLLEQRPIIMHTIDAFHNHFPDAELVVVLPSDQIEYWKELCKIYCFEIDCKIAIGGESRYHSVKNGLERICPGSEIVMVHDAVRPFVCKEMLQRIYCLALEKGAVIPVVEMVDSIREKTDKNTTTFVDRSRFVRVQTPQAFFRETLLRAYQQDFSPHFTDDASVVETSGVVIHTTFGTDENIKITSKQDMLVAGTILYSKTKE